MIHCVQPCPTGVAFQRACCGVMTFRAGQADIQATNAIVSACRAWCAFASFVVRVSPSWASLASSRSRRGNFANWTIKARVVHWDIRIGVSWTFYALCVRYSSEVAARTCCAFWRPCNCRICPNRALHTSDAWSLILPWLAWSKVRVT